MFLKGDSLRVALKSKIIEDKPISYIFNKAIQSLQQTEWDVEIRKEYVGKCKGNNNDGCFLDSPGHDCGCYECKPKLDENNCLILKRI
jgi:hypothetical protein